MGGQFATRHAPVESVRHLEPKQVRGRELLLLAIPDREHGMGAGGILLPHQPLDRQACVNDDVATHGRSQS